MSTKPFEPKFMKVGVLTAALQELTPREKRDPDPDLAIEEWVAFARELGFDFRLRFVRLDRQIQRHGLIIFHSRIEPTVRQVCQ